MYLSQFKGSINKGERGEGDSWQSLYHMLIKSIVSKWSFGDRLGQVINDLKTLGYAYARWYYYFQWKKYASRLCTYVYRMSLIYLNIQSMGAITIITWFYSRLCSSASVNSKFHNRRSPLALIFGSKARKTPRICLVCILTLKNISHFKFYVVRVYSQRNGFIEIKLL